MSSSSTPRTEQGSEAEYRQEEAHLQRADDAAGVQRVKDDLDLHFTSVGPQQEGGIDLVMHSAREDARLAAGDVAALGGAGGGGGLEAELRGMAERHGEDGIFVLGVASAEGYEFADEEGDAE
jgi:hypothetical protein